MSLHMLPLSSESDRLSAQCSVVCEACNDKQIALRTSLLYSVNEESLIYIDFEVDPRTSDAENPWRRVDRRYREENL